MDTIYLIQKETTASPSPVQDSFKKYISTYIRDAGKPYLASEAK